MSTQTVYAGAHEGAASVEQPGAMSPAPGGLASQWLTTFEMWLRDVPVVTVAGVGR